MVETSDIKYTSYKSLKGADFSTDPSRIDYSRSPEILNLISDDGGNPVKRKGWEIIADEDINSDVDEFHRLYFIKNLPVVEFKKGSVSRLGYLNSAYSTLTDIGSDFSFGAKVSFGDSLYSYDISTRFAKLDNVNGAVVITNETAVPTVTIATDPDTGAGTSYEPVNMLSNKRTIQYMWGGMHGMKGKGSNGTIETKTCSQFSAIETYTEGDTFRITDTGTAKNIQFLAGDLAVCTFTNSDSSQAENSHWMKVSAKIKVVVPTQDYRIDTTNAVVERLCEDGSWFVETGGSWGSVTTTDGITYYTYTFPTASKTGKPTSGSYPIVTVSDNVKITVSMFKENETVAPINPKCACVWNDRVFMYDGQYIRYSEFGDPSYIADVNYVTVDGEVKGLVPVKNSLAVIKEDSSKAVDFITETTLTDTVIDAFGNSSTLDRSAFKTTHGISGFGAMSGGSLATLSGEPLYLTKNGVVGIVAGSDTDTKYINNRSYLVDKKLITEPVLHLKTSSAVVYKSYYILAVGDKCYVLDARQKATDVKGNTTYLYEAYLWDNISARSFAVDETHLWFIRSDNSGTHICRFKNDGQLSDYSDATVYGDDTVEGVPIHARFATLFDNDGYTSHYKTLQKKGTGCSVVPDDRSSCTVYLNKDDTEDVLVGTTYADKFNFEEIDFDRFTFETGALARDYYFRKKNKRYKRLQIILENNVLNESFGILEIFKTYEIGNYAKR